MTLSKGDPQAAPVGTYVVQVIRSNGFREWSIGLAKNVLGEMVSCTTHTGETRTVTGPLVESLVERIVRTLTAVWAKDPLTPGLLISIVPTGEYFVSVRRYPRKNPHAGVVVFRRKAASLADALELLAVDLDRALTEDQDGNGNALHSRNPRALWAFRDSALLLRTTADR